MLENQITQLAEELHLPSPETEDGEGFFHISLSETITIAIKSLNPGLFLAADVGFLPTRNKEDNLMYFMKANFLFQGTGGQVLGVNSEEKSLTLSQKIVQEVNYLRFKEIIEDFANYLGYWQKELERLQQATTEGII